VKNPDLRLLAIAGPPVLALKDLVDACVAAEAGGVTAVQLRAKSVPAAPLLALTETLCAALTVPVYVNDRADIALAGGAHGVHVGTDDLAPSAVRDLAGDALHIGVSVGNEEEAIRALTETVDYWSVGSIFATGTKPDAGTPIGTLGFKALADRAPQGMTVIAIGGITEANVADIMGAGADGVAVSHGVFGVKSVEESARAMRRAIEEATA
jgi:thiamine-phosphate pyrophosphorylase